MKIEVDMEALLDILKDEVEIQRGRKNIDYQCHQKYLIQVL